MENEPSDRLLNQRVRNRIMEELSCLAEGQEGLRSQGSDYRLAFLDWFPNAPKLNPATDIMLPAECDAVADVLAQVLRYSKVEGHGANQDRLTELEIAEEIAPLAHKALEILNARGRFDEKTEEETPTGGKQRI